MKFAIGNNNYKRDNQEGKQLGESHFVLQTVKKLRCSKTDRALGRPYYPGEEDLI